MNLLLEADSSEKLIRQYLVDGDLFTLTYKNEVACVAGRKSAIRRACCNKHKKAF